MAMIALLLAAAAPITAPPLPAISKWNVDYGSTNCMLGRKFTDGKSTLIVSFRSPPLSGVTDVVVAWPSNDQTMRRGRATIVVNSVAQGSYSFLAFPAKQGDQRLWRVTVPGSFAADAAGKLILSIQPDKEAARTFAMPAAVAGFAALEECNQALLKEWGIDLAERAKRVPTPAEAIDRPKWMGRSDYHDDAILNGAQGSIAALLTIQPDGRVDACRVMISSGAPALDEHTCRKLVQRARYRPARDSAGVATDWYDVYRINWMISGAWD